MGKVCYLIRPPSARFEAAGYPTCTVAYTCVSQGASSDTHAQRFVDSYRRNPGGLAHKLVIICNGGGLPSYLEKIFRQIDCSLFLRSNDGWDIGGYLELAKSTKTDLLVCLGESVYFHRPGWLIRIGAAWKTYGPGMYGCFSSFQTSAHLNTSAFACSPELMRDYPTVKTHEQRYAFEHSLKALWRRLAARNKATVLVTWDGVYEKHRWRHPANILWRGDQSNCLVFCNHTDRYAKAAAQDRRRWEAAADTFRQ